MIFENSILTRILKWVGSASGAAPVHEPGRPANAERLEKAWNAYDPRKDEALKAVRDCHKAEAQSSNFEKCGCDYCQVFNASKVMGGQTEMSVNAEIIPHRIQPHCNSHMVFNQDCAQCRNLIPAVELTDLVAIARDEVVDASRELARILRSDKATATMVRLATENVESAVSLLESREEIARQTELVEGAK